MSIFRDNWLEVFFIGIPLYFLFLWFMNRPNFNGRMVRTLIITVTFLFLIIFGEASMKVLDQSNKWVLIILPMFFVVLNPGMMVFEKKRRDELEQKGMSNSIAMVTNKHDVSIGNGTPSVIRSTISMAILLPATLMVSAGFSGAFFNIFKPWATICSLAAVIVGMLIMPKRNIRVLFMDLAKMMVFIVFASIFLAVLFVYTFKDDVFMKQGLISISSLIILAALFFILARNWNIDGQS